MKFLNKLKEVALSILPIVVICLCVHLFVYGFSSDVFFSFLISSVVIIFGETLFFLGVDTSIIPMGEIVGESSNKSSSKFLVLILFGLIFGMFATIAEPDVSVLAGQVSGVGVQIAKTIFVFLIGFGVGVFVAFALLRIVLKWSLRYVLLTVMAVVVVLVILSNETAVAIAFDAGGATTGIITSPFLIAIASSLARNTSPNKTDDSFGVIGIASLGPVLALLFYFLIGGVNIGASSASAGSEASVYGVMLNELEATSMSVLPLIGFFFIYELIFVKLPKKKNFSLLIGSLVTFVGLYLFLFGIDFGFTQMGTAMGEFLSGISPVVAVVFCAVLGFVITFSEPAVKILGKQIEEVTGGFIKTKVVLIAIAISLAFAIGLSAVKIMLNINFNYIIVGGYLLAMLLMLFSSPVFIGIGFDSGGVASGPISSAFVLPLMIGLASGTGGFGVIALVSLMPILVLETLGIVYKIKIYAIEKRSERRALRIAYDIGMLSQTDMLKKEWQNAKNKKRRQADAGKRA
ncbi:MAG: DUF1538 family protein [Clostridia bacterium]|nr:DUF1538 family protein [Clostridia bacterium]